MAFIEEDELMDVVDRNDNVIGSAGRDEIHQKGLCHRSVHVFLVDGQARIYLQKRTLIKREHPGRWDSSASGHVLKGEPYGDAAKRELIEELGIAAESELKPVLKMAASAETGWEHSMLFTVQDAAGRWKPVPNPQEISEGRFFTNREVLDLFQNAPHTVSPAFRLLFEAYCKARPPVISLSRGCS